MRSSSLCGETMNRMTSKRHLGFASTAASGSDSDASVGDEEMLRSDLTPKWWLHLATNEIAQSAESRPRGVAGLAFPGFVGIHHHFADLSEPSQRDETATGSTVVGPSLTCSMQVGPPPMEKRRVGYMFAFESSLTPSS